MAVTAEKPAPYAPSRLVLDLIKRHREKGLPKPIDAEVLGRVGVTQSLMGRTLYALQVLDLINEKGEPSPAFEAIRKAPQGEYEARLVEWLNAVYADVLQFIDPATADETAVRDAFRNYTPVGQQDRMVSLFIGLYAAAGVAPPKSVQARAPRANVGQRLRALKDAPYKPAPPPPPRKPPQQESGLPPALAGLLTDLPAPGGGWTQHDHDRFLKAFTGLLDYSYPIIKPEGEAQ